MTKRRVKKRKQLVAKTERYDCGCSKSFKVGGNVMSGFNFICYEHGVGKKKP